MNDFAISERPQYLSDIVGNKRIVTKLQTMVNSGSVPHTMMFVGPSGCGKSSFANVMINELKVDPVNVHYIDCGLCSTIDNIRDLADQVQLAPIGGWVDENKIYILEECHKLGSNKKAQEGLLYMLENLPGFCYVVATTTNPEMLLPTLLSRFEPLFRVNTVTEEEMLFGIIKPVCLKYNFKVSKETAQKIYKESNGCPRVALRLLYSIKDIPVEEQQIEERVVLEDNLEMLDIYKKLVFFKGDCLTVYKEILESLELISSDWEGHRQALLTIAGNYTLKKARNSSELLNACYLVKSFENQTPLFSNFASNLYLYLQTIK